MIIHYSEHRKTSTVLTYNVISYVTERDNFRILINCILLFSSPPSVILFTLLWIDARARGPVVPFPSWLLSGEKGEESTRRAETIAHSGHAAVAGSSGSK